MKKKKFLVSICQEEFLDTIVEAETEEEARQKVEEDSTAFDWESAPAGCDFDILDVEEIKTKGKK